MNLFIGEAIFFLKEEEAFVFSLESKILAITEDMFKNIVHFPKGINMMDLTSSEAEFHIDMDFKKKKGMLLNADDDLFPDTDEDDDSDNEDVLKTIEESTNKTMLSSPEYLSFEQLAANMIDCLASGDVKMFVTEEGDAPLVPYDAEVTIHYAAYWEGATIPFDSTLTRNCGAPERIRLGTGRCLPGLEIGLSCVRGPAARLHLLVRPALAWGPRGAPPRIRPETALFVIALYDVRDVQAAARFHSLPTAEQTKFEVTLRTVKDLRVDAKMLFSKRKYKRAINNYQQAINVLSVSRPENEEDMAYLKQLKIKIYANLAVCYYKLDKPKYIICVCENIDRMVDINTHCKALFYYGRAYEMLGKVDEAITYYKKALKMEPDNKDIGKILARLDEKTKISAANEKDMWQKAFGAEVPEKKVVYNVDEDFKNGVIDMCQELAGRGEYAKFQLPHGVTEDEIDCIKSMVSQFKDLVVQEDCQGKVKRVSIIRKS